ncbi:HAMP domain-containing histidine kinase [Sporolactobacillus shoreicorticis]|uniref:histidine kinase n=1 Tax=Sporolactobacillus shoreicorticis TaxID=1923877 RepID=A0ABW5S0M9_9BACL|nr:HAMP domain-containing sensor histidine kinase [Sporolactobacillus shoreicorticis]MCO7124552.1 HAMP domain-containing histidine kinase [Sporolactobacillus shoreicorticis]
MIIIMLTLTLGETVLAVAVHHYFYGGIRDTLIEHAEDANTLYRRFNDRIILNHWSNSLSEVMDNFRLKGTTLFIYNADGSMIASSTGVISSSSIKTDSELLGGNPLSRVEYLPQTKEKVMSLYYPIQIKGKLFILRYVSSLARVDRDLLLILIVSLLSGVGIALLVFFVSLKLAQSIVMPIKHIINVSSKMAVGNFSIRIKQDYRNELGVLARTLNAMADEIQKNERLQNTFISSVSHDLLTPLTGIKGWSETMLMNKDTTPEEFREGLNVISKESDRLKQLVGDLLDLSKLKQNTLALNRQKTRLDEVLKQAVASVQIKAAAKGCQVIVNSSKKMIAEVDGNRLQQVIVNLLDNAIKFSHADTQIIADLAEDEATIRLSVKDWGIIVDAKEIPKLTDPFYQTRANGRGSGLGLAISKNIVDLHGGRLSIKSTPETGTDAVIVLPKNIKPN